MNHSSTVGVDDVLLRARRPDLHGAGREKLGRHYLTSSYDCVDVVHVGIIDHERHYAQALDTSPSYLGSCIPTVFYYVQDYGERRRSNSIGE